MRLSRQTFRFGEFLQKIGYQPRRIARKALVHGHCCGMVGSFGLEQDKYEVSIKIGEQILLPAVRNAAADTLVVADGFSCRERVAQCINRTA